MKYISLAAHNNELIIINDMGVFTTHFCYSKKQRQGVIDAIKPPAENTEDDDISTPHLEMDIADDVTEEDDI